MLNFRYVTLMLVFCLSIFFVSCDSRLAVKHKVDVTDDDGDNSDDDSNNNVGKSALLEIFDNGVNEFDYGRQLLSTGHDKYFTVKNVGDGEASGMGGSGLAAPFSFKGGSYPGEGGSCGKKLDSKRECLIVVRYIPATARVHNDTIVMSYNNGSEVKVVERGITGNGYSNYVSIALLEISDSGYDYGSQLLNTEHSKTFTVTNVGNGNASGMIRSGLKAPFSFNGGSCAGTLVSGGTCTIIVKYVPTTASAHNDIIVMSYSNGQEAKTVERGITGAGYSASVALLQISDSGYNYGSQLLNSEHNKTFTVSNVGSGNASGMIRSGLEAPFSFNGGTCVGTLVSGGTCTIVIKYLPTTESVHGDTIIMSYNNGQEAKIVERGITGTGYSAGTALLEISDSGYNYGSQVLNMEHNKTFTVSNVGDGDASSMVGSGLATPFSFNGGTCAGTLVSGGTCTIIVKYFPTTVSVHSDTIIMSYNNGSEVRTVERGITGTGRLASVALLEISDSGYNYGSQILNTEHNKTFIITNTGNGNASSMVGSGLVAPFSFNGGTCDGTLVSGGTCTMIVRYVPTTESVHSDTIIVSYNGGQEVKTVERGITGTGYSNPVTVDKTIGWNANPEHEILVGYKLYFGAISGTYDGSCVQGGASSPVLILISELADPNNPTHTIENFKVNSACYFAISSYNAQHESALSGSIAYNP